MKKSALCKKFTSLFMTAIILMTMFGYENFSSAAQYEVVKDGLVAWYDAEKNTRVDALILNVNQVHCGNQRVIVFTEEVVLVLHPCHDAAIFKFNSGFLPPAELIAQIWNAVELHHFTAFRHRREDAADLAVIIPNRRDKQSIAVVVDRCGPCKEL